MNSVSIANTAVTAKPAKLQFNYSLISANEDLFYHNRISLTVNYADGNGSAANRLVKIIHQILCVDNEFESLSDLFFTPSGQAAYRLTRGVYFHNLSLIPEIMLMDELELYDLIKNNDIVVDFENTHANSSITWKIHVSN